MYFTNLQSPPVHWTKEKIASYHNEVGIILNELEGASAFLSARLRLKIDEYKQYFK